MDARKKQLTPCCAPATTFASPCREDVGDRLFLTVCALAMLGAVALIKAPIHRLIPAAELLELAPPQEDPPSLWSVWAATPRATLDFPRVRDSDEDWLGPVRTPNGGARQDLD